MMNSRSIISLLSSSRRGVPAAAAAAASTTKNLVIVSTITSATPISDGVIRSFSKGSSSGPPQTSTYTAADPSIIHREKETYRRDIFTGEQSIYKLGKHRSNALDLIRKIPPVEVDGDMAICDGGGGALGHPNEYIALRGVGYVDDCKYCGLRYTKKGKK